MTGLGASPLRLCVFARDIPNFGCGFAALGLCGEYLFTGNPEESFLKVIASILDLTRKQL
jgi:hypothetical protein